MLVSIPALLLTAGWVVLVAVILVLFGRTAGGAWSIAGDVARGVRSWAGQRRSPEAASSGSPSTASKETTPPPPDRAEVEEL